MLDNLKVRGLDQSAESLKAKIERSTYAQLRDFDKGDGYTVLHKTAWKRDQPDVVLALIECGCDVNAAQIKNTKGTTALHIAGYENRGENARALLEHGADRTLKDDSGKTAADHAREQGHAELAAYIDGFKLTPEMAAANAKREAAAAAAASLPENIDVILIELGLGSLDVRAAGGRFCEQEGAESADDLEGKMIERFVDALEQDAPLKPVKRRKLLQKLGLEVAPLAAAAAGDGAPAAKPKVQLVEEHAPTKAEIARDLKREASLLEIERDRELRERERHAPTSTSVEGLRELLQECKLEEKMAAADAWCVEEGCASVSEIEADDIEKFAAALDLKPKQKKRLVQRLESGAAAADAPVSVPVDQKELTAMISYTQKNQMAARLAVSLYYKMREMGFNVWLDVKADDKSEAAMQKNVEGAKFVIAIISDGAGVEGNGYFERPFCLKELRWAKTAGKYVQPIVDSTDKSRIGEFLGMAPDDLKDLGSVDFVDFNQTDDDFFSLGVTKVLKKAADATGDPVLKAANA